MTSLDVDKILDGIKNLSDIYKEDIYIMEVCGTHTQNIAKFGIKQLLPKNIKLVSGPGCPVCVTDTSSIDNIIKLAQTPNTIIVTLGDLMRLPGSESDLLHEKSKGADIRVVYSPAELINIAKKNTSKNIIYPAFGFETTAPITALLLQEAKELNLENLFFYCLHKTMPEVIRYICKDKTSNISGFILPGHVCTITGAAPFRFIAKEYNKPCAVCGFEMLNILQTILMLVKDIVEIKDRQGSARIINNYKQCVHDIGNTKAQEILNKTFTVSDSTWRGMGEIKNSGLKINSIYKKLDAEEKFKLKETCTEKINGCRCSDILTGKITPKSCLLFKKTCTPQHPVGPCMVSQEGTCSTYFKYNY